MPGLLYHIADISNSFPHVAAPRVDVLSAWPGGKLHSIGGNSMVCPHIAGVAALWWERLREARADCRDAQLHDRAVAPRFTG